MVSFEVGYYWMILPPSEGLKSTKSVVGGIVCVLNDLGQFPDIHVLNLGNILVPYCIVIHVQIPVDELQRGSGYMCQNVVVDRGGRCSLLCR